MNEEKPFIEEPPIKPGENLESQKMHGDETELLQDKAFDGTLIKELSQRKEMLPAIERLEIIKKLRAKSGVEAEKFLDHQFLEYKEANPSPYGVTLGIEIEIPQASVLPENSENWTQEKKRDFLDERRKKYEETVNLGVPRDPNGPLWEFAELPVHNPATLAREVQALIGLGLIDTQFAKFPLHITIGGITLTHCPSKKGKEVHVLLRSLDASGWCTDGSRILMPYNRGKQSWYRKGESGILERDTEGDEFVHDKNDQIKTAVELRTPQVQSLFGLDRYLHSAYYLSSALRAYQNTDEKDPVSKKLADIWKTFSKKSSDIFKQYGLENPQKLWKMDPLNPQENSPFQDLAKMLDRAKNEPKSRKAQFVHDIRLLIIKTRSEIKNIMEEDREKRFLKK